MRFIADGVDLSGDTRQIGSFGTEYAESEVTGWSDGVVNVTLGQQMRELSGYQAVFNNGVGGAYTELSALEEYIVSLPIGINAAPAVGNPAFMGSFEQISYDTTGTDAILLDVEFRKSVTDADVDKCWGIVLANATSRSGTWNGTSVDNGASSANGLYAQLHVVDVFDTAYTFKIQDSPDDAAWADVITFTIDGTSLTAEASSAAGTVDRYLRFQGTAGTGTGAVWSTAVRL